MLQVQGSPHPPNLFITYVPFMKNAWVLWSSLSDPNRNLSTPPSVTVSCCKFSILEENGLMREGSKFLYYINQHLPSNKKSRPHLSSCLTFLPVGYFKGASSQVLSWQWIYRLLFFLSSSASQMFPLAVSPTDRRDSDTLWRGGAHTPGPIVLSQNIVWLLLDNMSVWVLILNS